MSTAPLLSIIVIAYNMPRQAMNTLLSLRQGYQEGVSAHEYEVILVENRSTNNMNPEDLATLPDNFRYFLRDDPGVSPAAAINFGFSQARGRFLCLIIDGARMVTPGVVRFALMAFRITPDAMVVVPGYHLGENDQQFHLTCKHTEEKEKKLLVEINWQNSGYRLFESSCWSPGNRYGVFHPFMECNCLFMSAEIFRDIGQADERFNLPGGGGLNLYLYRKVAMHQRTQPFVLAGEGSFHQFHGGVTTSEIEGREVLLDAQREQLNEFLGTPFRSPTVEPIVLGKFRGPALRYLKISTELGMNRIANFTLRRQDPFADEKEKISADRCLES